MKRIVLFLIALLTPGFTQEGARYLIIAHDNFCDETLPLAHWKYLKGMKSKVVKLSDIGSSAAAIRDYVAYAYNNWDIPPEYLLLVGAPNYIPLPTVSGTYSDNYYTNIEGDVHNDILSGRLTVHNATEAATVINKILIYERYPYRENPNWFKSACLMVRQDYDPPDDSIYWSDLHFTAGLMVSTGFVKVDSFSDVYGHNVSDLLNAANEGRGFFMYRGSAVNNWWTPFNVNPDNTQNGSQLPIVMSITCSCMGTGSTPATAERWLLTGTPTEPRGGAGYFATTTVIGGGAYLRSAVAKGFHRELFTEDAVTFGQACEGGRVNVYELYPGSGGLHEYLGFTTLGDPEMLIWKDTPCSLEVNHPSVVTFGFAPVSVNVTDALQGTPIENAIVCLSGKIDSTVYVLDSTDANGHVTINITPQIVDDTVFVTVTGLNLQPYEGSMRVIHTASYVIYLGSEINDSLNGNNDGIINPTENIELPLSVVNLGQSTAVDVDGTLRSNDGYIVITDSVKNFGDISSQDTANTGPDGYNFTVQYSAPNLHTIDFSLTCRDINDSVWISQFSKTIYSPTFSFESAVINGGNGNNILEPAETVNVIVTIKNNGSAAADSVRSSLYSQSPQLHVLDSIGVIGHIGTDSAGSNDADPFVICVDESTSVGTVLDCELFVFSDYCEDTFNFVFTVDQKNYFIWNPDPTPKSGDEIQSILRLLRYDGDSGTTLPAYLNLYQTLFVCLGVYSNRHLITEGSAEADMIIDFINSGGRVYLEGSSAWFVDPTYHNGHDFGPLFGISSTSWSLNDLGPLVGQNNTFTNGMYFDYLGENWYMDHIAPAGNGYAIFQDGDDDYYCAVAHDGITYRTVGTNFELGYLEDGTPPSTRAALLDSIMHFFGTAPGIKEFENVNSPGNTYLSVSPNPGHRCVNISFGLSFASENVTLSIYDATGRLIYIFPNVSHNSLNQTLSWSGTDQTGLPVSAGVYFVKLDADRKVEKTTKIVLLR